MIVGFFYCGFMLVCKYYFFMFGRVKVVVRSFLFGVGGLFKIFMIIWVLCFVRYICLVVLIIFCVIGSMLLIIKFVRLVCWIVVVWIINFLVFVDICNDSFLLDFIVIWGMVFIFLFMNNMYNYNIYMYVFKVYIWGWYSSGMVRRLFIVFK